MAQSEYLANKLNDHVLKGVAYTPPTDVYIGLFKSANGLDSNTEGSQVEATGGSYARLQIDNSTLQFTTSASKVSTNNENWLFPTCTADWGVITHVAIMDAATSGNVLYWGALSASTLIETNDIFRFLAGELDSIYG